MGTRPALPWLLRVEADAECAGPAYTPCGRCSLALDRRRPVFEHRDVATGAIDRLMAEWVEFGNIESRGEEGQHLVQILGFFRDHEFELVEGLRAGHGVQPIGHIQVFLQPQRNRCKRLVDLDQVNVING